MRLVPRSILGRLIAGTLLTQVVVFGCFLFFGLRREVEESATRSAQRLREQTRIIASLAGEAMAENDAGQVTSVFRSISITTILHGARLTDASGDTLRVSNTSISPVLSPKERDVLPDLKLHPQYRVVQLGNGATVGVLPF